MHNPSSGTATMGVTVLSAQEAIEDYAAAWQEPDEDVRRQIIAGCWAEDGEVVHPDGIVVGREGLNAHISRFRRRVGGAMPLLTSRVDTNSRFLRFEWRMIDPLGEVILEGCNYGELDDAGLIRRIVVFYGLRASQP